MATITISQSLSGTFDGNQQSVSSGIRQEVRTAVQSTIDVGNTWRTVFSSTDTKQACFAILINIGAEAAVYRVSQIGGTDFTYFDLPAGRGVCIGWDTSRPFASEPASDVGSVLIEVYSASGTSIRFLTAQ